MLHTESVEPELFPLSKPMIVRLAEDRNVSLSIPASSLTRLEDQIRYLSLQFEKVWAPLLYDIEQLRLQACEILHPVLQNGDLLTTEWLKEQLQTYTFLEGRGERKPFTSAISDETFRRWRTAGLLRARKKHVDFHAATAILMMRLADHKRERGFLPPGDYHNEPYMYVWRQDAPGTPAVPCGLPLSEDVPKGAFLYSKWLPLGLLHDDWLPFRDWGSVRWAGTVQNGEHVLWDLSYQELMKWDPEVAPLGNDIIDGHAIDAVTRLTRHTLANLILLKLSKQVFAEASRSV